MVRVDVGVEEAYRQGFDAALHQAFDGSAHLVLVEIRKHRSVRADAFAYAHGIGWIGGWIWFLEGHPTVERTGSPGAGEVQDLLVTLRS